MRPITVGVSGLAAASATNVRTATAVSATGSITLNGSTVSGGVATLDIPRHVLFTVNADESAKVITLTGTTFGGNSATETITLPAATGGIASVLDYKTVTAVSTSAPLTSTLAIGTTAGAGSPWVRFDDYAMPQVAIQVDVTGSATYTVQQTLDDPNSPTNPVAAASMNWLSSTDASVSGSTGTAQSNYAFAPAFARVLISAGATGTAGVSAIFQQASSAMR